MGEVVVLFPVISLQILILLESKDVALLELAKRAVVRVALKEGWSIQLGK